MSPRKTTLVAGIIGGIGSGKSAVSTGLSSYFHILMIDADRIGHKVLDLPTVRDSVRRVFGDVVFDGVEICRKSLARQVFGSEPSHRNALTRLEEIVHPQIRKRLQQQLDEIDDRVEVVVLDAAVMLEAGWDDLCDTIIFVDTPFDVRLTRVQKNRGWTSEELQRREASQTSIEKKRAAADFTVDNSGTLEDAIKQLVPFIRSKID